MHKKALQYQILLKSVILLGRYFSNFQDGGRPAYWIRLEHIWTIHSEYLWVTITPQIWL